MAIQEHQLMDFEPLPVRDEFDVYSFHMQLYYVLDGCLSVQGDDGEFTLKGKDFYFVNIGYCHSRQIHEGSIVFCFVFNEEEIGRNCDISGLHLQCNSLQGPRERHEALRRLLDQCVGYYYGKRSEDEKIFLKLQSIYFQILEQLLNEYLVHFPDENGSAAEGGRNEIQSYIYRNYKSQIMLNDMAEWLHLSPSYISRYLKNQLGTTFGNYLTNVRLEATVHELVHSKKSVTRIAMDNGFPNMTAFHKAFRNKYGMTPTQYQERWKGTSGAEREAEIVDQDLGIRLMDYVTNRENHLRSEDKQDILRVDAEHYKYINKSWNRMINAGRFSTMLRSDMQEQVLFLKNMLGYEYVRLWDLYAEEMRLNISRHKLGDYNFKNLDRVLDFLVEHQIHPYIELGFKPNILLDSNSNYYLYEEREIIFDDLDVVADFLRNMMIHLINRYGRREVSQWYFELWLDPRLCKTDNYEDYFLLFEFSYREIKSVSPETFVCGCYDQSFDVIDFETLIRDWSRRSIRPDYLVLYCYRETIENPEYGVLSYKPANINARTMSDYISDRRRTMMEYGFNVPLNICEWGLTTSNRNALNDSCFKGAFLMKSVMEIYDQVDMMGYWMGSDLMVAETEPLKPLDGCCGLISHQGLCKPAFWAMEFMGRLGNYLLGKTENVMVTKDNYGNYMLSCHNCNDLDRTFYRMKGDIIEIEDMSFMFRDKSGLKLHVEIGEVENGAYQVKTWNIKAGVGSVQDEWRRMGMIPDLMSQDVEYLKALSRPRISIYEIVVEQNRIELDLYLESQEIQSIAVSRQFKV